MLIERQVLRYTPAGVPVCEALLQHESEQIEAEIPRQVSMQTVLIALGENARWLDAAPLGAKLGCTGFLAPRRKLGKLLALHLQKIRILPQDSAELDLSRLSVQT